MIFTQVDSTALLHFGLEAELILDGRQKTNVTVNQSFD